MSAEKSVINRRDLIKGTAALAFLSISTLGSQLASDYIDHTSRESTEVQPHLKNNIESSSMFVGVYPQENNLNKVPRSDTFGVVGYFRPWNNWMNNIDIYNFSEGQIPMFSVIPVFEDAPNRPFKYKDLVEQKDHIRAQARELKRFSKCLFRYGYEMNGNWFPHGSSAQSPQEFIDGWKLVIEIVKEENPAIKTLWSPNIDYTLEPYYPYDNGSALEPDYVGLDGYNKHHLSPFHIRNFLPNPSPTKLFGKDIRTLQEMTNKPILIAEVGVDYGDTPRARRASFSWMVDALESAATFDKVVGVCLFAWNKSRGRLDSHEGDWGNILTDALHDTIQQNSFYSSSPLA